MLLLFAYFLMHTLSDPAGRGVNLVPLLCYPAHNPTQMLLPSPFYALKKK